ncbi:adenylyl-sulfate kinase [Shigella flexneri]
MVRERVGEGALSKCLSIRRWRFAKPADPKGLYKKARAGELRNFTDRFRSPSA